MNPKGDFDWKGSGVETMTLKTWSQYAGPVRSRARLGGMGVALAACLLAWSTSGQAGPPGEPRGVSIDDDQYALEVVTLAQASATAHNAQGQSVTDPTSAEAAVQGAENLGSCNGRISAADARGVAAARPMARPFERSVVLTASSRANGGHYVVGPCFFRQGHDTAANASAQVWADFTLSFVDGVRPVAYEVKWALNREGTAGFQVATEASGPDGSPLNVSPDGSVSFVPRPASRYRFRVLTRVTSRDNGACCVSEERGSLHATISVSRVPILAAISARGNRIPAAEGTFQPYIIGGRPTSGYLAVGAIVIGERLHCTGTLVAPRTVLTAAHCLAHTYGKDLADGRMAFRTGPFAYEESAPSYKVVDRRVPAGYTESSSGYTDDIALAYLERDLPSEIKPYGLHLGSPGLPTYVQKRPLDFIGFGYDRSNEVDLGSPGIKRQAAIKVRTVEPKRFFYGGDNKQTCGGDSGGPAFLDSGSGRLLVAGVTSGGDEKCTVGAVDTRVDSYQDWLLESGALR